MEIAKMASPWLHRTAVGSATENPFFLSLCNLRKRRPNVVVCERRSRERGLEAKGKKENVWSVDNVAETRNRPRSFGLNKTKKPKKKKSGLGLGSQVLVSGAMLMEVETLLQTQEPVIVPVWNTFASSVSGIWKGVGAVFSPITARMEPVEIGSKNEELYDCYTWSHIEAIPASSTGKTSQIKREINWVTLNPHGEMRQRSGKGRGAKDGDGDGEGEDSEALGTLPKFSSFDLERSDLMEEDTMVNEPGLVFFEDGSYSRGPVDIPVGDVDESNYFLSPTFKFEQCLVKGCHIRLRIVHTIEFSDGGSDIQILRVAVYEEQWVSPANIRDESDAEFDAKPFSQRKRTQPSQLTGSWKVFEVSATPIIGEDLAMVESNSSPFVYLCMETLKKRSLPDNPVHFKEEEMVDMQDVTMLWLPGGVTAYVDVKKDGVLCIGVGWYSDEGINLVMERDYGVDGKLKDVRYKSEVKRRWPDPVQV